MRTLRVVGLDEDGETVLCEDPESRERFAVPADERLRAAARGDLTRLGQVQIEMESQLRPREIQTRIRGGATVDQVAETAGIPAQRVERYAYPVLLERSQTADLAQRAHPVREDGPDVQTLGEVVSHAFNLRGQDYSEASWDAWRGEDGKWVVQLHWQAGRSENSAHWVFHPGAHGGTVAALDDHAADLLDPSPNRPLRTVRPVTELAREALELEHNTPDEPEILGEPDADSRSVVGGSPEPSGPSRGRETASPRETGTRETRERESRDVASATSTPSAAREAPPRETAPPREAPAHETTAERPQKARSQKSREEHPPSAPSEPEPKPATQQAPEEPSAPAAEPAAPADTPVAEGDDAESEDLEQSVAPEEPTDAPRESKDGARDRKDKDSKSAESGQKRGRKGNHPIVPSWEDVLLGVRSQRG